MVRLLLALAGLGVFAGSAAASGWAEPLFPERSHDFGTVARGPMLDYSFRLTNSTAGPVHIAGIRIPCSCVQATVAKRDLAPGESTLVAARLDTTRATGPTTKMLYIQFDQPQWDEVGLTVFAHIREDLSLTPNVFTFGRIDAGAGGETSMTVRFPGLVGARVLAAKCDSSYVAASVRAVTLEGGETAFQVTTRVRKDLPVGSWYSTVWLQTDQPGLALLNVPLQVEVAALLSCTPADFGQVAVGTETTRRVVVRADKPFRIVTVKSADAALRVEGAGSEAKATHVLTVHLKPAVPGTIEQTLQVVTDLAKENQTALRVTAVAVP